MVGVVVGVVCFFVVGLDVLLACCIPVDAMNDDFQAFFFSRFVVSWGLGFGAPPLKSARETICASAICSAPRM